MLTKLTFASAELQQLSGPGPVPARVHALADSLHRCTSPIPTHATPEDMRRRAVCNSLRWQLDVGVMGVVDEILHDDDWNAVEDGDVRVDWAERLIDELRTLIRAYDNELVHVYGAIDRLGAVAEAAPAAPTPGHDSFRTLYADAMLNATDYVVKRGLVSDPGLSLNRTQCVDLLDRAAALAARGQAVPVRCGTDLRAIEANEPSTETTDTTRERTCRTIPVQNGWDYDDGCSNCGEYFPWALLKNPVSYCPNCGAKVVDE